MTSEPPGRGSGCAADRERTAGEELDSHQRGLAMVALDSGHPGRDAGSAWSRNGGTRVCAYQDAGHPGQERSEYHPASGHTRSETVRPCALARDDRSRCARCAAMGFPWGRSTRTVGPAPRKRAETIIGKRQRATNDKERQRWLTTQAARHWAIPTDGAVITIADRDAAIDNLVAAPRRPGDQLLTRATHHRRVSHEAG